MPEKLKFDDVIGTHCIVEGEYLDDVGNIPINMIGTARHNSIKIKRQKITYTVDIFVLCNRKTITICADTQVSLSLFYELLIEIIRFENLFEGLFFPPKSIKIDEEEFIYLLDKYILGYIKTHRRFSWITLQLTATEYKKYFNRFVKVIEKRNLGHQVYLYAAYSLGMTADLRLAVLLQIFEPLANELVDRGKITFKINPYKVFTNNCNKCGQLITRKVPNKELFFYDKMYAIVVNYGKDIFAGDSRVKVTRKAVNLRNRVDHVNKNSKNYMTGSQCGFYILKFDMLYRRIIFEEIGIDYAIVKKDFIKNIDNYNKQFPQCRICP